MVDKGSSMCLYDDRYYFLKLKNSNTNASEVIHNLPPAMNQRFTELVELAKTSEEQQALLLVQQHRIAEMNMKQQVQLATLQMKSQLNTALCNTMMQSGVSFANAAMPANATSHYELVNRNTGW